MLDDELCQAETRWIRHYMELMGDKLVNTSDWGYVHRSVTDLWVSERQACAITCLSLDKLKEEVDNGSITLIERDGFRRYVRQELLDLVFS